MSAPVPAQLLAMCNANIDFVIDTLRTAGPPLPGVVLTSVDDLTHAFADPRGVAPEVHREILAATCALLLHRLAFQ